MHDDRELIAARLERALRERIRPAVHRTVAPLEIRAWHLDGEPVPPAVALSASGYQPFAVGDAWGPPWGTCWFELLGTVPGAAAGQQIELVVDLGWTRQSVGFQAEGLAYRPDGSVLKGLNPRNGWLPITASARGGEPVHLYVEAASNPFITDMTDFRPTPLGERSTAGDAPLYRLARADISVLETEVWELVQDLEVVGGLARELSSDGALHWRLWQAISQALDALDLDDIAGSASAARAELADVLRLPATASAHRLSAIGHAHIDSAWLWPVRETVRKVARTAANVAALLDDHSELVYAMSSAQQFAWLEEHRPEVFERVAEHVKGGRFVPVGGMWVESDTNLPSGESLVRQLIYGTRYFLETFGIRTEEVWLPDSFGYSAALPQLIRLSGARWFLTQKISWNEVNRFPHHTFWWEGIDGTRVFTHFPPVDRYNAELSAAELAHAARNFRDKSSANRSLVPFGHGDGGGGPTREMLARARRTANLEGSPRVTIETPAAFFAAAEREYQDAPTWVGELYLEMHRGTYTSQAQMKQGNRRAEQLLHEAELWCATAAVAGVAEYPYEALARLWKTVLLHQFHDILPGTSIGWVHREAADTYRAVQAELVELVESAQRALAGDGAAEIVFNAAPVPVDGVAPGGAAIGVAVDPGPQVTARAEAGGRLLDNGLLRVRIDARGVLTSVYDLAAGREVLLPDCAANLLELHPDVPNKWDAWDVDSFYRNRSVQLTDVDSLELDETPASATVRVRRSFGRSRGTQEITLVAGQRRVDFSTEVDWHERERFLKCGFPLDVHTDRAAYETQFGHLYRPTHENTTWDAARFEVCAHRFVHLAEGGYGIALVNDSTYGHDVRRVPRADGGTGSVVRLSLLRAPRFPDPETDQGVHRFRYALVPGADLGRAVSAGYALNLALRRAAGRVAPEPLVHVTGASGMLVETVKLAEDRSGDVVVRLYEALGGRAAARLGTSFPVHEWTETDLLEQPIRPNATAGCAPGEVRLRPFQVVTMRASRTSRSGQGD